MAQQHPFATRFVAEIELLAHKENCLLWAMDRTFSIELFMSSTFKNVVHRDVWEIYQNKSRADFEKNLDPITSHISFKVLQDRLINPKYTAIYGFKLPQGGVQMILDRSFHLCDAEGNCLLIAGVAVGMTEKDFSAARQAIISDRVDKLILEYYSLLMLPMPITNPQPLVELTKQQKFILKYILHGLTAKQIAKETKLSFRTVEFHTNAIKETLGANSKSELISIAISKNLISISI